MPDQSSPTVTRTAKGSPAAIVQAVVRKLEAAERELEQARQQAESLMEMFEDGRANLPRFQYAVDAELQALIDYLGPEHAGSQFEIALAVRDARELQALVAAAKARRIALPAASNRTRSGRSLRPTCTGTTRRSKRRKPTKRAAVRVARLPQICGNLPRAKQPPRSSPRRPAAPSQPECVMLP
jgi:hypothetical protein